MRRLLTSAVAALSFTMFVACGSDNTIAPQPLSMAGTWNLQSINGTVLPFILQAANPMAELVDDHMVVLEDGTFTETYNIRLTDGATVQTLPGSDSGTLRLSGTAVTVTYSDGTPGAGNMSATSMSVTIAGFTLVFARQ
jgi:hypothetical protein